MLIQWKKVAPNSPIVRSPRVHVLHSIYSSRESIRVALCGLTNCSDPLCTGKVSYSWIWHMLGSMIFWSKLFIGLIPVSSIRSVSYIICRLTYAYNQWITGISIMLQGSCFPVCSHMSVWIGINIIRIAICFSGFVFFIIMPSKIFGYGTLLDERKRARETVKIHIFL